MLVQSLAKSFCEGYRCYGYKQKATAEHVRDFLHYQMNFETPLETKAARTPQLHQSTALQQTNMRRRRNKQRKTNVITTRAEFLPNNSNKKPKKQQNKMLPKERNSYYSVAARPIHTQHEKYENGCLARPFSACVCVVFFCDGVFVFVPPLSFCPPFEFLSPL